MNSNGLAFWVVLGALVFLYPQDAAIFAALVAIKTKTHVLNAVLFIKAYGAYRQICSIMGKMGVAPPPFRFVPIWERDL